MHPTKAGDTCLKDRFPCSPTPPTHFFVAKRKKENKGKKERVWNQKLLKGWHQGQNVTVLAILERLEFKNFSCWQAMVANKIFQHGMFSVFHDSWALKSISPALYQGCYLVTNMFPYCNIQVFYTFIIIALTPVSTQKLINKTWSKMSSEKWIKKLTFFILQKSSISYKEFFLVWSYFLIKKEFLSEIYIILLLTLGVQFHDYSTQTSLTTGKCFWYMLKTFWYGLSSTNLNHLFARFL